MAATVEPELELVDVKKAAAYLDSSPSTIRLYIRKRIFTPYGTRGKRLVDMAEVRALAKQAPTKSPEPPHKP